MLYGVPLPETDLDAWFAKMNLWGVKRWMPFGTPDQACYQGLHCAARSESAPFLQDAWPGFRQYIDTAATAPHEMRVRKMAGLCRQHGIEFWYHLPFPIFPSLKGEVIQKAAPEFFPSGRFTLDQPRIPELLKAEIRTLKKALPTLRGISLWMTEGTIPGFLNNLAGDEIENNTKWQTPILKAFDEITHELGIKGMFFAHNYLQTVRTHRNVFKMAAGFPRLTVMDDITWPEEDMQHPFLGYLPKADRNLMLASNPVAVNCLLDTEYIGEGVLPSVYPRWWQYNIREAVRSGVKVAMGRVFRWDAGQTDVNFNRMNAHIFTRLCYRPDADVRTLLEEAAKEMFGPHIPVRLVEILWETEPVIKEVTAVNGVDVFDHSRFPRAMYLDVLYTPQNNAMKAVDDMFLHPGTQLYPPLTDELNNYKQWRWQNKTVSQPAQSYIQSKKGAVAWVARVLPEVRILAQQLLPAHRDLFVHGYELLDAAAKGMELFVEAAALHYQWAHAKTINDRRARKSFDRIAAQFRTLANGVPKNPLLYKERMIAFADFLEHDLPRISRLQR
ncbi:MAG: hypothetical protein JSS87_12745 [Acidobacteria bacterium]|nr:hypothetical protein [Acidobacteriota bacterium]